MKLTLSAIIMLGLLLGSAHQSAAQEATPDLVQDEMPNLPWA